MKLEYADVAKGAAIVVLLAGAALSSPAMAQSATGEALYKQRCMMCHTHTPDGRNGVGPGLYGVTGRAAASTPGFSYSPALKASKLVWTPQTLDQFLAAPGKMVPGTRMVIAVPDAKQRKDIVEYLASSK